MVLALFVLLGALVALAYTVTLAHNSRLYLSAKTARGPVLLHVARTAGVIAAIAGFASAGSKPFIAGLVGFTGAHLLTAWRLA